MTTKAAVIPSTAPIVTPDELDLVRRTVANGATADELRLYLFDCARQGTHPLDKHLHFTKRNGKYTPVTSIDFMRLRAAETGEYAGSDDPQFDGAFKSETFTATVTVWRLVQGQRCAFTATAWWSEYKPDAGTSGRGDVMWQKMPHTMLAKCAEGCALRKGFPRQLAGLYAIEELDQARSGADVPYVIEAPAPSSRGEARSATPVTLTAQAAPPETSPFVSPGPGVVLITKVEPGWAGAKAKGFVRHSGLAEGADALPVYSDSVMKVAEAYCQDAQPCRVEVTVPNSGKTYLRGIVRVAPDAVLSDRRPDDPDDSPIMESDIPF